MPELQPPPSRARGLLPDGTSYAVYGQGTPIVFIHGVGMQQDVWVPQILGFARDRTVVTFDMLGHGRSPLPPENPALADYADQVKRLLDQLDLPRAHIVGHSMGALVALEFALREPARCLSVSALNAVYNRSDAQREAVQERVRSLQTSNTQGGIAATLARWFGQPIPPYLETTAQLCKRLLEDVNAEGYARTYALFATSDRAHIGRLSELQPPALFMTGELDPNSTPDMTNSMAAAVPGSRCRVLAGERHMMGLTGAPQVHGELLPFLLAAEARANKLEAA